MSRYFDSWYEKSFAIALGLLIFVVVIGFFGNGFVVKTVDWTAIQQDQEIQDLTKQNQQQQEKIVELEKMQPADWTFAFIVGGVFIFFGLFIYAIYRSDERSADRKLKERELAIKEKAERTLLVKDVEDLQNPYPKDVFVWNSKKKVDFNRGRFNQHCFEVFENARQKVIELIKEND